MRGRFTWTPEEHNVLHEAYKQAGTGNVNIYHLAKCLNRLPSNVSRKARSMGLTRKGRPQTADSKKIIGEQAKKRIAVNPNPKFTTRGLKASEETREKQRLSARKNVLNGTHPGLKERSPETRQKLSASMHRRLTSGGNVYSRSVRGVREDVRGIFFRSRWEANYARFLEFQKTHKAIIEWEYEPVTFWFEKIKRGVRSYLPDFRVTDLLGNKYYVEVKGWMDPKSKTKLKRMAKYYPGIDLRVVGSKEYREINRSLGTIIPNWES